MMWYYIVLISILGFIILAILLFAMYGLRMRLSTAMCKSTKKLEGKTVIVTGGSGGIGFEVSLDIARRGAKLIFICPFEEEGNNARKLIIKKTGNQNIIFKLVDLSSLNSVRTFADYILQNEDRLDILINNAGVLTGDVVTGDGLNFIMQVNYFGPYLLTLLLLPLLRRTGEPSNPSRIVNTSSLSHSIGEIDFDNMHSAGHYNVSFSVYANSKLAVAMFTRELAKRLKGSNVTVNSADPSMAVTNIGAGYGKCLLSCFSCGLGNCFPSARHGAQTTLHLAVDEKICDVTGEYFQNCKKIKAGKNVYEDKKSLQLWEETIQLVKLNSDEIV